MDFGKFKENLKFLFGKDYESYLHFARDIQNFDPENQLIADRIVKFTADKAAFPGEFELAKLIRFNTKKVINGMFFFLTCIIALDHFFHLSEYSLVHF